MNPTFETVVRKRLKNLAPGESLEPQASLKELGLDSMQAVELMFDLEDELGIVLPDDAMTGETFATASALEQAVLDAGGRAA